MSKVLLITWILDDDLVKRYVLTLSVYWRKKIWVYP